MFESSLISNDQNKQRGKRWLSFPIAVGLHLVVLVSLGFAQYWNVEKVPEPDVIVVFHAPGGSPPAPPRGRKVETSTAPVHKPNVAPVPRTVVAQPQVIPERSLVPAAPEPANNPAETTQQSDSGDGGGGGKGTVIGGLGDCTGDDCSGGGKGEGHGSSETVSADVPLVVGGAVTRPVILERVEPQYTETARRVRLEGTVIVQAVIDEAGRVTDVKVLKNLPMGLDKAAVDAVSRWRFQPATLHGRPVKVYYSLTVVFRVQ